MAGTISAGTISAGLSRVTVVAPRTRIDLALPTDVPLANMLPTLLRYAGDGLADDPAGRNGWVLTRLGGVVLDSSRTPAQLEVRDGELLYLKPRDADTPVPVFDDVVDAVATATQDRAGRWQPATTRAFGVTLGLVALVAGIAVVLLAGPPHTVSGVVGLGLAAALVVTATVLSRAVGDTRAAVVVALVAAGYAGVGGLLLFGGDRALWDLSAPHALIGATGVLLATTAAAVAVGVRSEVFLAAGAAALALLVGAVICLLTGAGPAGAAAVVVTVTFAAVPAMPMLSYRFARLPVPSVPSGPEDLKRDAETVDGERVLAQSDRADAFLAAMLTALAVVGAASAVLVATAGLPGLVLAAVLGALLMARARWFISRAQRLPLLIGGAVGLGAAAAGGFAASGPLIRLGAVLGGLLLVAVISIAYGMAGPGRRVSPLWGRTLDIVEVLLILSLVPLAMWVSGLYAWIRAIRG